MTISTCLSLYFLLIFLLKIIWVCTFISNHSKYCCVFVLTLYCSAAVLNISLALNHKENHNSQHVISSVAVISQLYIWFMHSTSRCVSLCILGVAVLDHFCNIILHHSIYHCALKQQDFVKNTRFLGWFLLLDLSFSLLNFLFSYLQLDNSFVNDPSSWTSCLTPSSQISQYPR